MSYQNDDKKKQRNKYKQLTEDRIRELRGMTEKDLHSAFIKAKKNEKAAKKIKKDDEDLNQLTSKIKTHRDENMPKKVKELQDEIKDIKDSVDEEIKDELEDKKALSKGHSNGIKGFVEEQDIILEIIRSREM